MKSSENQARHLEGLLPQIMRSLFRPDESDPVNELPMAQLRLMRLLHNACLSGAEIAQELHISASAFSQLAHRLEEAGLIEYNVDAQDRRIKRYTLTEKGWEQMRNRQSKRIENAHQVLDRLSPQERDQIVASLELLLATCRQVLPSSTESLYLTAELEQTLPLIKAQ